MACHSDTHAHTHTHTHAHTHTHTHTHTHATWTQTERGMPYLPAAVRGAALRSSRVRVLCSSHCRARIQAEVRYHICKLLLLRLLMLPLLRAGCGGIRDAPRGTRSCLRRPALADWSSAKRHKAAIRRRRTRSSNRSDLTRRRSRSGQNSDGERSIWC